MILKNNYSLLNYNSFKIDVKAKEFIEVNSTDELKEICKINNQKDSKEKIKTMIEDRGASLGGSLGNNTLDFFVLTKLIYL